MDDARAPTGHPAQQAFESYLWGAVLSGCSRSTTMCSAKTKDLPFLRWLDGRGLHPEMGRQYAPNSPRPTAST